MRFLKCTTFLGEDGEWWFNSISPSFTKIKQKSLWSDPSKSPSTGIEVQRVSWKFIRIPRLTSANQLHPKFPWSSITASTKIQGEMTVFVIQLSNSISIGVIQETKSADFTLNMTWYISAVDLMILRFHEPFRTQWCPFLCDGGTPLRSRKHVARCPGPQSLYFYRKWSLVAVALKLMAKIQNNLKQI